MSDFISTILVLVFLSSGIFFVISLINPKLKLNRKIFKSESRKKLTGYYLGILIISMIGVGITAPPQDSANQESAPIVEEIPEEIPEPQVQAAEIEPEPETVPEPEPHNPEDYWHEVLSVVDGDTVKARIDGESVTIRIIGIDAPESTIKNECYGNESSKKAKEFLSGKWIKIESDSSQDNIDKYGRSLRFVYFDQGTDFGKRMIEEGYAYEYTYDEPYKYQKDYKFMQDYAKRNSHGLWAKDTCNGKRVKASTAPAPKPSPAPTPAPAPSPSPQPSNCDPNYTPCVPKVNYDLNCSDIGFSVRVIGTDIHGFDGDDDGYGCESY